MGAGTVIVASFDRAWIAVVAGAAGAAVVARALDARIVVQRRRRAGVERADEDPAVYGVQPGRVERRLGCIEVAAERRLRREIQRRAGDISATVRGIRRRAELELPGNVDGTGNEQIQRRRRIDLKDEGRARRDVSVDVESRTPVNRDRQGRAVENLGKVVVAAGQVDARRVRSTTGGVR
jgi:hypothetical protein